MSDVPELSIVVPVHNCRDWIIDKLTEIRQHFGASSRTWELIVVDDGSADGTADVIRSRFGSAELHLIALQSNLGKGAAVLAGLRAAHGSYRIFMDCDLAYPLSEADKILAALKNGADVAVANRRLPESICELKPALFRQVHSRELYGRLFNRFIRMVGLSTMTDTQAGLKGMRAWVVDQLDLMTVNRFAFDIELLHIAARSGARCVPVPVRYSFLQGVSTVAVFRDGVQMVTELARVKMRSISGAYHPAKSKAALRDDGRRP